MNTTITPAPVRRTLQVKAAPARAFDVFTSRIGAWWPRDHTINKSPPADVVIEPRVGGRWFERGEDASECQWGRVLVWEPPSRLVLAWQVNAQWQYDPGFETEVELRFVADGTGTRVEFEHRNLERFGERADTVRNAIDSANGWTFILARYVADADL